MFLLIISLLLKHVYVYPKFQEEKHSKILYGIFGAFETPMEAKNLYLGNVNCCHRTSFTSSLTAP